MRYNACVKLKNILKLFTVFLGVQSICPENEHIGSLTEVLGELFQHFSDYKLNQIKDELRSTIGQDLYAVRCVMNMDKKTHDENVAIWRKISEFVCPNVEMPPRVIAILMQRLVSNQGKNGQLWTFGLINQCVIPVPFSKIGIKFSEREVHNARIVTASTYHIEDNERNLTELGDRKIATINLRLNEEGVSSSVVPAYLWSDKHLISTEEGEKCHFDWQRIGPNLSGNNEGMDFLSILTNESIRPLPEDIVAQSEEHFSVDYHLFPLQPTLASLLLLFSKALIDQFGVEGKQLTKYDVLELQNRLESMQDMSFILPFKVFVKIQDSQ